MLASSAGPPFSLVGRRGEAPLVPPYKTLNSNDFSKTPPRPTSFPLNASLAG